MCYVLLKCLLLKFFRRLWDHGRASILCWQKHGHWSTMDLSCNFSWLLTLFVFPQLFNLSEPHFYIEEENTHIRRLPQGLNEIKSVKCAALCLTHDGISVNKSDHYHPLSPWVWHYVGSRSLMGRPFWKFQVGVIVKTELSFTKDTPNKAGTCLISSKNILHQPPRGCKSLWVSPAVCICFCQTNYSLLQVLWIRGKEGWW